MTLSALAPGRVESLPEEGDIHVWRASLLPDGITLSGFEGELSEHERERGTRFHFRVDAEKFIAAHGVLRRILGAYTGLRPRDLMFSRSASGKPSLANGGEACAGLRFNMADSGDTLIVAVSRGREVGVDIEQMKPGADLYDMALRCFCEAELNAFRKALPGEREEMFYTYWTRKEAYVKARGEGMSLVLRDIDVSTAPALLSRRWWLEDLTVDRGYRGAVVLERNISSVIYRTIPTHGASAQV